MACVRNSGSKTLRLVGDPVDVVSGANVDEALDLKLAAPLPFEWWRHYSSQRNEERGPLGWGHTHEYDRRLQFDLDGLCYIGPDGGTVAFPLLDQDGENVTADGGLILIRVAEDSYRIEQLDHPSMEFLFTDPQRPALLNRLFRHEHALAFHYHADGRLKGIVDAQQRRLRIDHNERGLIVGVIDHAKNRSLLSYRYDQRGNLIEGIDAYGHAFQLDYDEHNRVIGRTDRRGYRFHFDYDREGRCTRSYGDDGVLDTRLDYRPLEKTTHVTQADGGQWVYHYNDNGVITRIKDPAGGVRQFNLDGQGRVSEEIDPNGNVRHWLYSPQGAWLGKQGAGGYEPAEPVATDWSAACPFEWEYGRLVPVTRLAQPVADDPAFARLPVQALSWIRAASSDDTALAERFQFDPCGVLVRERCADGSSRRLLYDPNGNVQRYTDSLGGQHHFEYASWNHPVRMTDPLGHSLSASYTVTEQVASFTDAGGTTSEYAYDAQDRLTEIHRHGRIKESYRYDGAGNVIEKCDAQGNTLLSMDYGPANRRTARRLATGEQQAFSYDGEGRLLRATGGCGEVTLAYDSFGHRSRDQRDGLGISHRRNARDQIETTFLEHFVVRSARNFNGDLELIDPAGERQTLQVAGRGVLLKKLSNGSTEVSQFDGEGRCLRKFLLSGRAETQPWVRTYAYSSEGMLLTVDDSRNGTLHYGYDAAQRLEYRRHPDGQQASFRYDAAGNLLTQPGLDAVVLRSGNRLHSANDERFAYDQRNHVSARQGPAGTIRYHYDSLDRLVRCELPNGEWRADYDPLGRRIGKSCQGQHSEYYWDGERLAAEVAGSGQVRIYLYPDPAAVVPLMFIDYASRTADPASGQRYFLYTDQVGAPLLVEDERGQAVWRARVDPYGYTQVEGASTLTLNLRFPGHYFDAETGLHYNRFRYYDPRLGRYLQSDPIGIAGGVNLYAYTDNPLTQVDITGTNCAGKVERRIWSVEELNAAKEHIDKVLQPASFYKMVEIAKENAKARGFKGLNLHQNALHEALNHPTNRSGGNLAYPNSRIPLEALEGRSVNAKDLHALTQHTGLEHGVVRDREGRLWLTRGDPNSPGADLNEAVLVHTHPHDTPPSPGDLRYGPRDGGSVIGPDGQVTDFKPGRGGYDDYGQDPYTTKSYVADDGTIDGRQHDVEPIIKEVP